MRVDTVEQRPILVWGAGAIGGSLGAAFVAAGHDVLFVDQDADHVTAMNERGLEIQGPIRPLHVPAKAQLPENVQGRFSLVFLAVKAHHTAHATRQLLPHLADDGVVVSAQNGLNESIIADIVGTERTIGCFVNFGADYLEPGRILYGGRAAVVVGELDGVSTDRVQAIHQLLLTFDDRAVLSDNIWGYLWSKMIYGAMLYVTALTDDAISECLAHPNYRRLFIALSKEIAAVATNEGITLEAFDGFTPDAYGPHATEAEAIASLDALVAHNRRSVKTHSGIWRDLAVRQRKTEVDAQLTPILEAAQRGGIAAPIIAKLISLVQECENGSARGWHNLDSLSAVVPEAGK